MEWSSLLPSVHTFLPEIVDDRGVVVTTVDVNEVDVVDGSVVVYSALNRIVCRICLRKAWAYTVLGL